MSQRNSPVGNDKGHPSPLGDALRALRDPLASLTSEAALTLALITAFLSGLAGAFLSAPYAELPLRVGALVMSTASSYLALSYVRAFGRWPGLGAAAISVLLGLSLVAPLSAGESNAGLFFLPFTAAFVRLPLGRRIFVTTMIAATSAGLAWVTEFDARTGVLLGISAALSIVVGASKRAPGPKTDTNPKELAELRAIAERVVRLREEERTRIGRELHDGTGQLVHGLHLELDFAKMHLGSDGVPLQESIERMASLLTQLSASVREVLADLRPAILDEAGVARAIATLVETHAALPTTRVEADIDESLVIDDQVIAITIYRIAQEAITNALRHAGASAVRVVLRAEGQRALLVVADDGSGIPEDAERGYGLANMHERAALVGADLRVEASERGTTIRLRAPLHFEASAISSASIPTFSRPSS